MQYHNDVSLPTEPVIIKPTPWWTYYYKSLKGIKRCSSFLTSVDRHSGNQTLLSSTMFGMTDPQTFFEGYHAQEKGKKGKEITNTIYFRDLKYAKSFQNTAKTLFVLTIVSRWVILRLLQKNLGQWSKLRQKEHTRKFPAFSIWNEILLLLLKLTLTSVEARILHLILQIWKKKDLL